MPERAWYRSLYWRIALGFILFLAVMLVAQGGVLLWLLSRSSGVPPGPRGLATLVASEVGSAMSVDPDLDLPAHLEAEYGERTWPFFLLMSDGQVITTNAQVPPGRLVEAAHNRLQALARRRPLGRGPGGRRFAGFAPILVDGTIAGLVIAIPVSPLTVALRQFGPTMMTAGGMLLVVGTGLAALLIFRPARARLRGLEAATRLLGAGDLSARAPDDGGDEIAAVARSFNRMADDLTSRAEEVQASDRARRQLLADVSHELMTPLTAMRGYIETLTMPDVALDAPTRARYLGIIGEETLRLEQIIGDLLDLARLEGGGGDLRLEPIAVRDLFDRVTARHERECHERGINLAATIAEGASTLVADPHRLEQALQNLAANAVRHTPDGGTIGLEAAPVEDSVRVTVRDSGPGIPAEHLPLVFNRFYKVDAARGGSAAGSGLGLSIVKAIISRHGGRISASRGPDGAIFEIVLPRHAEVSQHPPT